MRRSGAAIEYSDAMFRSSSLFAGQDGILAEIIYGYYREDAWI